jgi:hypothetical protein
MVYSDKIRNWSPEKKDYYSNYKAKVADSGTSFSGDSDHMVTFPREPAVSVSGYVPLTPVQNNREDPSIVVDNMTPSRYLTC